MSDSTSSGIDCIEYTNFASEIDLVAVHGKAARHVMVISAGAGTALLAVRTTRSGEQTRTLTTYDKWERALQITRIMTTTTVARIQVTW